MTQNSPKLRNRAFQRNYNPLNTPVQLFLKQTGQPFTKDMPNGQLLTICGPRIARSTEGRSAVHHYAYRYIVKERFLCSVTITITIQLH